MICSRCPAAIGPRNKTGLCRRCGVRRSLEDPLKLQRVRETLRCNSATPQATAARRAAAIRDRVWEKGIAACPAGCPARIRAGRRQSDTKLAAIPRELRADYRRLMFTSKLPATEARRVILDQHEHDMAAFRRGIGGS